MRNLLRHSSRPWSRRKGPKKMTTYQLSLESLEIRALLSAANSFLQTNIISDIAGIAQNTDANLANPWGLAASATGPFWIADNGTGLATIDNAQGVQQLPPVTIPPPHGSAPGTTAAPTGVVFNGGGNFIVSENGKSGSALFIFATEDGTISGWNKGVDPTNAILEVDNSANPTPAMGAVYKGLAMGTDPDGRSLLYATNFRAGTVDIFDAAFHPTSVGASFTAGGAFHDPNLPAGFAPFNIANIGGRLYVTYAVQNASKHDDVAGPGNGIIDVYSTNGFLLSRLVTGGQLNSPWGLAIAPKNFGPFGGDLLVGNFGDGTINAYSLNGLHPAHFNGKLLDLSGNVVTIGGLWSLKFGNGGMAGDKNTLFFTAGIDDENHGLFGSLQATKPVVFGTNKKATDFLQTNLVSDLTGIAQLHDPNLKNPWGMAQAPGGPFWVSDNDTGVATIYNVNPLTGTSINSLVVNIPVPNGSTATNSRPTGQVFNSDGKGFFDLVTGNDNTNAVFIFATQLGTIAGWNPGVNLHNAVTKVNNSANHENYTGLALATSPTQGALLYAANNAGGGSIDVFDKNFQTVNLGAGAFKDSSIAAGFTPYNVQAIKVGGTTELVVTYDNPTSPTHTDGFVDIYSTEGVLLTKLAAHGPLNEPWGVALAPSTFGKFGGDLLIGNVGDGHISAFNLTTKKLDGQLTDGLGRTISIGGLWGLMFGSGGNNGGDPNTLYFTAGIGRYQHGLFGSLQAIEPIQLQHSGRSESLPDIIGHHSDRDALDDWM
jgi:uncharacterized protein (TIGR03118 family)